MSPTPQVSPTGDIAIVPVCGAPPPRTGDGTPVPILLTCDDAVTTAVAALPSGVAGLTEGLIRSIAFDYGLYCRAGIPCGSWDYPAFQIGHVLVGLADGSSWVVEVGSDGTGLPTVVALGQAPASASAPWGPTAAEVATAKAAVEAYTRLLVKGDWTAAYAALAPASRTPWGSLSKFISERSAFFKRVADRFSVSIPAPGSLMPIESWQGEMYGVPIDLERAVVVEVDYPALDNIAGWDLFIVQPGGNGLQLFDVR